jgi:molybdopterin-guanine dinucleotide biosynthesis protein A
MVAEGFVLAGGRSSRMGRDKALVELAGKPLVAWALEVLRGAGLTARIAGARADLSAYAEVIPDEAEEEGPLAGVCAALRAARAVWAVFVPVDLPLIPASLIRLLIEHARVTGSAVTVPSLNGFAQTFPAVVRRDALAVLSAELNAGRAGAFAAFASAGVRVVPVEMVAQVRGELEWPAYRWFWNVNTPVELEKVESLIVAGCGLWSPALGEPGRGTRHSAGVG